MKKLITGEKMPGYKYPSIKRETSMGSKKMVLPGEKTVSPKGGGLKSADFSPKGSIMKAKKRAARHTKTKHKKLPKLGTGKRFAQLKEKLGKKGAKNPGALAAFIGRRKYGGKKMAQLAAHGKKHKVMCKKKHKHTSMC